MMVDLTSVGDARDEGSENLILPNEKSKHAEFTLKFGWPLGVSGIELCRIRLCATKTCLVSLGRVPMCLSTTCQQG